MSRESEERKAMYTADDDFPKGAGDPDFYGYPGETVLIHDVYVIKQPKTIEELLNEPSPF